MKQFRAILRGEEGFSLTELVVATFLVTLGLISVAAVMTTVAKRQEISQGLTTATNLCTTMLEEVKGMPYDNVASSEEGFGDIEQYPTYKREVIVTPNDADDLKVVQVKVTNANGQNVTIETVVVR